MTRPVRIVTAADCDTADVHDARAIMNGKDECLCALCKRVRRARDANPGYPRTPEYGVG